MIFCILIGILEIVLFFTSKYIALLPTNSNTNYWVRDIAPKKLFHSNFWSHVWKEYGDYCDNRYIKKINFVHWLELSHALTSFIYIYIIYKFVTTKNIETNLVIGSLMVAISVIHITGTFVYFSSFYKYLKNNPIKKGNKFWLYLALNLLWVFMPCLILVKGVQIISVASMSVASMSVASMSVASMS
jgi:hypothetical protein